MIHDEGNPEDKRPPNGDGNTNQTHVKTLLRSDADGTNIMCLHQICRAEMLCVEHDKILDVIYFLLLSISRTRSHRMRVIAHTYIWIQKSEGTVKFWDLFFHLIQTDY